jgi:hypothetical protein
MKRLVCSYDWRSVGQSVCASGTHLGPTTTYVLLWSCGISDVVRTLWREGAFVVYNCCWSSPEQSFSGKSPAGLITMFYSVRFRTSTTWGQVTTFILPGTEWPVIQPGTGFSFRHLLPLATLKWRCSKRPSSGSSTNSTLVALIISRHRQHRRHYNQQLFHFCIMWHREHYSHYYSIVI